MSVIFECRVMWEERHPLSGLSVSVTKCDIVIYSKKYIFGPLPGTEPPKPLELPQWLSAIR